MAENNQTFAVPYEVHARQQLAAEMQALQENPLDETTPGGRYIGADGKEHDAEGKPMKASGGGGFDVEEATKAELEAEAERRGIQVTRSDGKDGEPLVEDYRKALA